MNNMVMPLECLPPVKQDMSSVYYYDRWVEIINTITVDYLLENATHNTKVFNTRSDCILLSTDIYFIEITNAVMEVCLQLPEHLIDQGMRMTENGDILLSRSVNLSAFTEYIRIMTL